MYVNFLSLNNHYGFNFDDEDAAIELGSATTTPRLHLLKYQQHFRSIVSREQKVSLSLQILPDICLVVLYGISPSILKTLYAVHLNNRLERHLNLRTLPSFMSLSHLIVYALRAKPSHVVDHIREALSQKRIVLIPVNIAGRLNELVVHLHDALESDSDLINTPLVILHLLANCTLYFPKSMIE